MMVTVGSILSDTVRFIRANPRAISAWAAIYLILQIVMRLMMGPVYRAQAEAIAQGTLLYFPAGSFMLLWLGMMVWMVMLYAAVFRAALYPEQSAAFYLRLGMDEARLVGLFILLGLGGWIAMLVVAIATTLIGIVVAMAISALTGGSGAHLMIFVILIALYGAMVFAMVRLSVAPPLTVLRRKIMIGPAWRLTRGKFWTLFGAYLVVFLGGFILLVAIMWPTLGPMFSALARPGDPKAVAQLAAIQAAQVSLPTDAGKIVLMLVGSAVGTIIFAALASAPAMATLQLVDAQQDAANAPVDGGIA